MVKTNPLRGEERRVVSTKLYRHEFVSFMKVCETEGKKVNAKLREMIKREIDENPDSTNKITLIKIKQGQEEDYKKIESKRKEWRFEIKGVKKK